ncbi:hypothetical protein [Reichenbachiella sp. MALMAid0571]|uniref:hypothetical protein n=1 Tax=Reichenbachiella sp. MALMAid0571 TaxID=3143939 RepID=UPI0032E02FC3
MKKFKRIFYLTYIIFFLFGGFIAINYENLVLKWDWDFVDTWAGLLRFVLKLGGFGLILFLIELIIENIHILSLNRKIKVLESDVVNLKSKLYDQREVLPKDSETSQPTDKEENTNDE